MLSYSAAYLTDGRVPDAWLAQRAPASSQALARLVEAGWVRRRGDDWIIPRYLAYNPSRRHVASERKRKADAGRKGAAKRWKADG